MPKYAITAYRELTIMARAYDEIEAASEEEARRLFLEADGRADIAWDTKDVIDDNGTTFDITEMELTEAERERLDELEYNRPAAYASEEYEAWEASPDGQEHANPNLHPKQPGRSNPAGLFRVRIIPATQSNDRLQARR